MFSIYSAATSVMQIHLMLDVSPQNQKLKKYHFLVCLIISAPKLVNTSRLYRVAARTSVIFAD